MATRNVKSGGDDAPWGAAPVGSVAPASALGEDDVLVEQSPIERVMVALQDTVEPGKRVRVQLNRLVPDGPGKPLREEWCVDLTPDEFEAGGLGAIRDTWGSGGYVVHLMGYKRGSPYFTRVASPRFFIAPLPGGPARSESSATVGIESAMRAMADSQARLIEMMIEQRSAPAAPPANPMAQMKEFLEMQVLMREASGASSNTSQKSSIGEIVDAIKELKEVSSIVNPGDAPEKSTLEQIIELASPLVAMAQQALQQRAQTAPAPQLLVPNQFNEVNHASAATRTTGHVEVSESTHAASQGLPKVSDSEPSRKEIQQSPQNLQSESEAQEVVLNELQSYLAQLVAMAEKGESFEKGAELVYDKLPDDWIELLHMNIWWDALKSAAPEVEKHEAWVRNVRDEVVRMFAEDSAEVEKIDGTVAGT